jgi:hypothetical protein
MEAFMARGFLSRTTAALVAAFTTIAMATAVAQAATFSTTVVTGDDAGEPGIAVGKDGAIYIDAPSGLLSSLPGSPSWIYKSTDSGASWTKLDPGLRANFPGGGDVNISIAPDTGTIYGTDLWLGSATVFTSSDGGATWLANPFQGVPVQDRQWVAAASGGNVYHATHQIPGGLIVSKSTNGLVYPIHTVAATPADQTGCVCPPGNLIAEGGGGLLGTNDKVGLIYSTSSGGVNFARSTNGGLTFTNVAVSPASNADTGQGFPVVANAGGGNLDAVWMEVDGNSSTVHFARSSDWGATWTDRKALVTAGTSLYPWVASEGSKVAVSLYHTDAAGTPSTAPESAQWFEQYMESTDGGATFSAPATVDPTVVKTGPICTEGINCSGDRELLDFQSLTVSGGVSDLTWTRSIDGVSNTELRFARQTG